MSSVHLFHHNHKENPLPHSFPGLCRLAYQPIATLPGLESAYREASRPSIEVALGSANLGVLLSPPTPALRLADLGVLLSPRPPPRPIVEISKPRGPLSPPPVLRSANLGVPLSPPTSA